MHLKTQAQNSGSSSTSSGRNRNVWVKLWQLEIPPRIKLFLWRACTGTLATGQNLHKRVKNACQECARCRAAVETDKHELFECHEARQVWRQFGNNHIKDINRHGSFKDWFAAKMETDNKEEVECLAVIVWLIWKARNEMIFENKQREAVQIGNYAMSFLQEYKETQLDRFVLTGYQTEPQSDSKWKPPKEGFLKINIDGSFTNKAVGMGLVIRDHMGNLEAVMTESIPHCFDATHAEALGFLKALDFAREFGITHFELEGNAQGIVNRIKDPKEDLSMIGHSIKGIRSLMQSFPDATCT